MLESTPAHSQTAVPSLPTPLLTGAQIGPTVDPMSNGYVISKRCELTHNRYDHNATVRVFQFKVPLRFEGSILHPTPSLIHRQKNPQCDRCKDRYSRTSTSDDPKSLHHPDWSLPPYRY
eukprot:763615-Hanusia_phi.AAC.2